MIGQTLFFLGTTTNHERWALWPSYAFPLFVPTFYYARSVLYAGF